MQCCVIIHITRICYYVLCISIDRRRKKKSMLIVVNAISQPYSSLFRLSERFFFFHTQSNSNNDRK